MTPAWAMAAWVRSTNSMSSPTGSGHKDGNAGIDGINHLVLVGTRGNRNKDGVEVFFSQHFTVISISNTIFGTSNLVDTSLIDITHRSNWLIVLRNPLR
jgi:hypothetical protein